MYVCMHVCMYVCMYVFCYFSGIVSDKRQEWTSTSQAQQLAINEVKHYFQKLPQGDDSDDPLDF